MQRKHSPLENWHREHGGKIVEFAGWELPVQFTSIISEHKAVREKAGVFDISHMAQLMVSGAASEGYLQRMFTNDLTRLSDGAGQYTHMLNESGGIIDDLFVFRLRQDCYFIVMNASRESADLEWLSKHSVPEAAIEPRTNRGALALQGPLALRVLTTVLPRADSIRRNQVVQANIAGADALVTRTGYTGEDGFEVFCSSDDAGRVWQAVWDAGAGSGLQACGLGARDTLRIEAGYPLYGHELDETVTPYEAGYGWVVKPTTPPCIGFEALTRQQSEGVRRRTIGLEMTARAIAREQCAVRSAGELAGATTSGTWSPTLGKAICMARIDANAGGPFEVEVHGRWVAAEQVDIPFYKSSNR